MGSKDRQGQNSVGLVQSLKKSTGYLCALIGCLASMQCVAQGTLQWTVRFDGLPDVAPGDDIATSYYAEQGMSFRPIGSGQFGRSGGGRPGRPNNGGAFLFGAFTYSLSITGNIARFGVVSVDLAEYSTVVPDAVAVQFVGYRCDGSTVTSVFATDGIMDGSGPLADFQTFYFDSQFADVVKVEVPSYGWCLDNMVFSNVIPEPGTWTLLILCGGLAGCRFWKRHRRYRTKTQVS